MNLYDRLALLARYQPDKSAVESQREALSYGELEALAARIAGGLRAAGVGPGDLVGLRLHDTPQHIAALFAVMRLGAIILPVDWRGTRGEYDIYTLGADGGGSELLCRPAVTCATPADVAAPPADAQRTASGLAYKVIKKGTGTDHPTKSSRVTVHYSGWQTNGQLFDSSVMRGQPASFGLGDVIEGWTEGVQLMVVGEKTRFWIPEKLAYKGQGGAPKGMLVFDVELISYRD